VKKIAIALIDDHQLFREGVAELVNGCVDFKVVLQADNGKNFIEQLSPQTVIDVALVDINMKDMDGFETAAWLKKNKPAIKVIALSMYENENAIIRMHKAGARGYLLKDTRKAELIAAIQSVFSKGYYHSELITSKLIHAIHSHDDLKKNERIPEVTSLSDREVEFLKWVCSDFTYKEIAEKMNLSVHTVDGYRESLFDKLTIKSRVGLALYAIKNNIYHLE